MQFFTQVSTTISAGTVQDGASGTCSIYTFHLKDVNNHNTFFGTDSHLQSISRQQRHNIIQYFSLKLSKIPGLPV